MERRKLIKNSILVSLAAAIPKSFLHATTLDRKQTLAPVGYKKIALGELQIFILTDGFIRDTNVDGYAPRAPIAELKTILEKNFRPQSYIDMAMNVPLIKTKDRLILLDAGMGIFADENTGKVLQSLSEAGFQPEHITDVFISHAHPDHIGGVVSKDFLPIFPNAKIHISKVEKDFWMQATIKDFQNSALKDNAGFSINLFRWFKNYSMRLKSKPFSTIFPSQFTTNLLSSKRQDIHLE